MYFDTKKITFEGPKSHNPLAFKYYDANEIVAGKPMKAHLRFAMSYWHTMTGTGVDPFGSETMIRPWDDETNDIEKAKIRVKVAFEFMEKLGLEYFCFHDRDIAPEQSTLEETNRVLDEVVDVIESEMKRTGIKLLWGTTNAFSHRRFVHGASTSCNADVFAYAAAQVKKAMEITKRLDGEGYVFWGGREGYDTLLNTNTLLEEENLARFLHMAVDYAGTIDFKGQFYIEPKPLEPTKHQYDTDSKTVIGFLRKYDLINHFKLNIETNHATLAGHTMHHELRVARENGVLGSIDANYGDVMLGWDTDQFPTNIYDAVLSMIEVLKMGGFTKGGLNFDAKVRRASFEVDDLFISYIAGMDTFAKGLKVAAKLLEDGVLEDFVSKRYDSYNHGIGKDIIEKKVGFSELEAYIINKKEITPNTSGRQEMLEAILNQYIYEVK